MEQIEVRELTGDHNCLFGWDTIFFDYYFSKYHNIAFPFIILFFTQNKIKVYIFFIYNILINIVAINECYF